MASIPSRQTKNLYTTPINPPDSTSQRGISKRPAPSLAQQISSYNSSFPRNRPAPAKEIDQRQPRKSTSASQGNRPTVPIKPCDPPKTTEKSNLIPQNQPFNHPLNQISTIEFPINLIPQNQPFNHPLNQISTIEFPINHPLNQISTIEFPINTP
jgi:hypothetical protein